jgi:hypothetical protein
MRMQGATYEVAARSGRALLERLVHSQPYTGPLPAPHPYDTAGSDPLHDA